MKLSKLIEQLEKEKKKHGDYVLKELKIVFPSHTEFYYMNSIKDNSKKMSMKEYVQLCKDGYWSIKDE